MYEAKRENIPFVYKYTETGNNISINTVFQAETWNKRVFEVS